MSLFLLAETYISMVRKKIRAESSPAGSEAKRARDFVTGGGLVLIAAICFGGQSSLVKKLLLLGSNPFQILFYELALATVVLGGLFAALRMRPSLNLRSAGTVLTWGAIGVGGTGLGLYGAMGYVPVALAIVLLFYYVPWVFLLDYLVYGIRPTPRRWMALGLILGGSILGTNVLAVSWRGLNATGVGLGLLGGLCYGTFIFGSRRISQLGTPLERSLVICAGTCVLFAIAGALGPAVVFVPPAGDLNTFVILLITVTFLGQIIPLLAFSRGIPMIGGSLAAIIASVELPVASLVAFLILGEQLQPIQWIGIGCMAIAVVLANWRRGEAAATGQPA